jgi:hypothetical protein
MDIVTRQQLNILIHLADRRSTPEQDLINRIASESDFPATELDQLKKSPEPIGSLGALSDNQKFEYLYSIVELMVIGRVEVQNEVLRCEQLALDLGFNKAAIQLIRDEITRASKKVAIKSKLLASI